ncbi:hypothetical protein CDAR_410871 [Caerostris darwini]|uniref:Uncharacterized protein n=1 Tax=Caerostris darwini TaxID=1538125 RepID=A0AAV4SJN3_9ARAC|nr:hypothetical protein CDAR_410871 [Caerostris darwini]
MRGRTNSSQGGRHNDISGGPHRARTPTTKKARLLTFASPRLYKISPTGMRLGWMDVAGSPLHILVGGERGVRSRQRVGVGVRRTPNEGDRQSSSG